MQGAAAGLSRCGGRAIIGRRDRGIDAANPKSLEGKKIAQLTGSTNEVYLREWFRQHGLDIRKSEIVNVPVEDMPITITQGLADIIAPWEPYTSQAIRELGPNAVVVLSAACPSWASPAWSACVTCRPLEVSFSFTSRP